jgi:tetratricopeptide (TPR) repeat protein
MPRQPLTMSPNYRAFVRGIRELHRLAVSGKDESPEADAVRDAMDGPWNALSDIERKRASGLSEDLYSISEPAAGGNRELNPQAQANLNDAFEARQRGEWDRALELIRGCAHSLAPDMVSFFRGRTWLDAGDTESAVLFFEHALQVQPDNGNYLAIFLDTLSMVDPAAAQGRAWQVLHDPNKTSPVAVAHAADIVFKATRSLPMAEATDVIRKLIPVLEFTLARMEACEESGVDRWSYLLACVVLSYSHEMLGETQAAVNYLTKGLQEDPDNHDLLVTRGMMLYGASSRAITDFELALRTPSSVVWPYYFLAHHYFVNGRFEECRVMCERGSQMPASAAVRSELAEWTAISQAELGFPAEMVRASFETAIRLDPSNDRARRNRAAYEAAIGPPRSGEWEKRSASTVRVSAQAERPYPIAERPYPIAA